MGERKYSKNITENKLLLMYPYNKITSGLLLATIHLQEITSQTVRRNHLFYRLLFEKPPFEPGTSEAQDYCTVHLACRPQLESNATYY